jgi:hypothetical protein
MQEEEVCFCQKNSVPRAPTDDEFQEAFAKYFGSGRRLQQQQQQQSKFVLLCVGSNCPVLAPPVTVPSASPTVNLLNPFGIQNYPGCVVPNESFIGDGFCDRQLDANGVPVYNRIECGYDGGDW